MVLVRVKIVIRRSRLTQSSPLPETQPAPAVVQKTEDVQYSYKELVIDDSSKLCYINNEVINLTKTEYELLTFLITHRNSIYTRKELLEKIWNNAEGVSDRTIDTNITRLRRKLGDYGSCIITRLGYGYGFQELPIQ